MKPITEGKNNLFFESKFVELQQIDPVPEIHRKFRHLNSLTNDQDVEKTIYLFCKNDPHFKTAFILAFDHLYKYQIPTEYGYVYLGQGYSHKIKDFLALVSLLKKVGENQVFSKSEFEELKTYICNEDYYVFVREIISLNKEAWHRVENIYLRRQLIRQLPSTMPANRPTTLLPEHFQKDILRFPLTIQPLEVGDRVFGIHRNDTITFYLYTTGKQISFTDNSIGKEFLRIFPKVQIPMIVVGCLQHSECITDDNGFLRRKCLHLSSNERFSLQDEENLSLVIWDYLPEMVFWGESGSTELPVRLQFLIRLFSFQEKETQHIRVIETFMAYTMSEVDDYAIMQLSLGKKGIMVKDANAQKRTYASTYYQMTKHSFLHNMKSHYTSDDITHKEKQINSTWSEL